MIRNSTIGIVLTIALTTWACSSNDSTSGGVTNPSPTPAPVPAGTTTVSILGERGNQSFSPNPVSVAQGKTIAWTNNDGQIHHIVANDGSFDTGNIAPGQNSTVVTLNVNGANYHCTLHPTMVGSINMSTGAPPPCTGPYCP